MPDKGAAASSDEEASSDSSSDSSSSSSSSTASSASSPAVVELKTDAVDDADADAGPKADRKNDDADADADDGAKEQKRGNKRDKRPTVRGKAAKARVAMLADGAAPSASQDAIARTRSRGLTLRQANRISSEARVYRRQLDTTGGHTDDVVAAVVPDVAFLGPAPGGEPVPGQAPPPRPKRVGTATALWGALLDHKPGDDDVVAPTGDVATRDTCWRPIFTASTDRNIRVWRAFLDDGGGAAGGGDDGDGERVDTRGDASDVVPRLRIEPGLVMAGHADWVLGLDTDPGHHRLYSGARDNAIRAWNVTTGVCVGGPFTGHTENVNAVQHISFPGATANGGAAPGRSRSSVARGPDALAAAAAAAATAAGLSDSDSDGEGGGAGAAAEPEFLLSGSDDSTVRLWRVVKRGLALEEIKNVHVGAPVLCATKVLNAGPAGEAHVFLGLANGRVECWSVSPQGELERTKDKFTCTDGQRINKIVIDEGHLYIASGCGAVFIRPLEDTSEDAVHVLGASPGKKTPNGHAHAEGCTGLAVSDLRGVRVLTSVGNDGFVRTWQLATPTVGRCVQELRKHVGKAHDVVSVNVTISPPPSTAGTAASAAAESSSTDMGLWVVSTGQDKLLRTWEPLVGGTSLEAQGITHLRGHDHWVWSIATDGGGRLFSASHDHTLKVWDINSGSVLHTVTDHGAAVRFVVVALNRIFTASADKTVKIFDSTTFRCLRTLRGHTNWVNALAVDSNRKVVYSVSGDATIKAWNVVTGDCIRTYEGHPQCINTINILHDLLLTGANDSTIRVWDSRRGLCLQVLNGHTRRIRYVLPDLDTGTLYSASEDSSIKIWKRAKNYHDLLSQAIERAESAATADAPAPGSAAAAEADTAGDIELYECTATLLGHKDLVRYVLKHGDRLYSSSNDATVRIWDLNTEKQLKVLRGGHTDLINSLVLIDGSRLLSSSHDKDIVQWDVGMVHAPLVHLQCRFGVMSEGTAVKMSGVSDDNGTTTLTAAAAGGNLFNAQLVRKHNKKLAGVDALTDTNAFGHSPLLLALRGRRWDFLRYFASLSAGAGKAEADDDDDDGRDGGNDDDDDAADGGVLVLPPKDQSVRELVLRRAARGDVDFFLQMRGANVLLGQKLEDKVILQALLAGQHEFVQALYGESRATLRDKVPLHKACILGQPVAAELLARSPKVNVNERDNHGQLPLHRALRTDDESPELKILAKRGVASEDFVRESRFQLWLRRIECARVLLSPAERSNKPNVLAKDPDGLTPYDRALGMHDRAMREMAEPLHEVIDQARIEMNRRFLVATGDVLEVMHDRKAYPEVTVARSGFARTYTLFTAVPYMIFVLVLTAAAFFTVSPRAEAFQTADAVRSVAAVRAFDEGAAFPEIDGREWFWTWINTKGVPAIWPDDSSPTFNTFQERVGPIELRQYRVDKPGPFLRGSTELTSNDDPWFNNSTDIEQSDWQSVTATAAPFVSRSGETFPPSGYVQLLDADAGQTNVSAALARLEAANWIDNRTRFITISVVGRNENWGGLTVSALFAIELDGAGGAWPDLRVFVLDPGRALDPLTLVLQGLVLLYVAREFLWRELYEIQRAMRRASVWHRGLLLYLSDLWNYIEWLIIALVATIIVLHTNASYRLAQLDLGSDYASSNTSATDEPLPAFGVSEVFRERDIAIVFFVLIVWMRLIKYLRVPRFTGPTTQSIIDTITGPSVVIFIFIILYVVVSFAIAFHLAFGNDVSEYYRWSAGLLTLFRMIFGDFDYAALSQAGIIVGPVMFTVFNFFVPLLLMNLLIAVLTEAYTAVHERNLQQWERSITLLMIENLKRTSGIRYNLEKWWKSRFDSRGRTQPPRRTAEDDDEEMEDLSAGSGAAAAVVHEDTFFVSDKIVFDESDIYEVLEGSSRSRKLGFRDVLDKNDELLDRVASQDARLAKLELLLTEALAAKR